jgi:phosphoribosylformylglycinamidine synthase
MLHIFRTPGDLKESLHKRILNELPSISNIATEFCFNVEITGQLSSEEEFKLLWLLTETFEPELTRLSVSFLNKSQEYDVIVEVGPRLAFSTAWSSNCGSMCQACGIENVGRIERSRRYLISSNKALSIDEVGLFNAMVHDRMTEVVYTSPLLTFENNIQPQPFITLPLLTQGKAALEEFNTLKGLGFDDWDLEFYTNMFVEKLKRNPTDVEVFDLGQSNSEHSRHWFFSGKIIIDGVEKEETLFQLVKSTLYHNNSNENSIIAFHDNSSVFFYFLKNYIDSSFVVKYCYYYCYIIIIIILLLFLVSLFLFSLLLSLLFIIINVTVIVII